MSAYAMFHQAPPVIRTLVAATVVISIGVHAQIIPAYWIYFHHSLMFKFPPQIWRLATCFMLSGDRFDIILHPYYMYQYGRNCERGPKFPKPADFVSYIVFVCAALLGINYAIFGGAGILTYPLIIAFAYTACCDEGGNTRIYVIDVPTRAMPWALCSMQFIFTGSPWAFVRAATGILAAHLYKFVTEIYPQYGGGKNYISTPAFLTRFFEKGARQTFNREYGTASHPGAKSSAASASGSDGPVLPEGWRTRGAGRRLGGE